MSKFSPEIVEAVLHHMNDDHLDDSLLIVRAFVDKNATEATMVDFDQTKSFWEYTLNGQTERAEISWPEPISTRPEIRQAVVKLYESACDTLGVEQRPH